MNVSIEEKERKNEDATLVNKSEKEVTFFNTGIHHNSP